MLLATENGPLRDAASTLGHELLEGLGRDTTRRADVLLVDGVEAWERVRGWREGGIRAGVVVMTLGPPPEDRGRLEPVALLRHCTPEAIQTALDSLAAGRPLGTLRLARGIADLDAARFRPYEGDPVVLSTQEVRLVAYLGARTHRGISREELQLQVWDHRKPVPTRAVDMAVSRLRKKLEADPRNPVSLITVRHGGYRLLAAAPEAAETTDLVGRDAVSTAIRDRLAAARCLVLHGAPGVGKTAVAKALAGGSQSMWVDLEGLRSAGEAAAALAEVSGIPPQVDLAGEEALASAVSALRGVTLVVFDHAEHLSAPTVAHALPHGISALIVRRTPTCEVEGFPLEPLSGPDDVALLAERVREAGATLSDVDASRLATLLDGLPLAIELAARRCRTVPPRQLAEQLERGTRLLSGGQGRHGSIDSALMGLWESLGASERAFWIRAAAFESDFELAEMVHIWGDVFDAWSALVDASVIWMRDDRGRLARPIRNFARERCPEEHLAARRAIDIWLSEAVVEWGALALTHEPRGFQSLVARRADIARGLEDAVDSDTRLNSSAPQTGLRGRPLAALTTESSPDATLHQLGRKRLFESTEGVAVRRFRFTAALDRISTLHGTASERLERVEAALRTIDDPYMRAHLLYIRARIRWNRDRSGAREDFEAAMAGDEAVAGRGALGAVLLTSLLDGAQQALDRLKAMASAHPDPVLDIRWEAEQRNLSDRVGSVDLAESQAHLLVLFEELLLEHAVEDALHVGQLVVSRMRVDPGAPLLDFVKRLWTLAEGVPDWRLRANCAVNLGLAHSRAGDLERAEERFHQAELWFERTEPIRVWQVRRMRAEALCEQGQSDSARPLLNAYVAWCRRNGSVTSQIDGLLWLASLEADAGRPDAGLGYAQQAVALCEPETHLFASAQLSLATCAYLSSGDASGFQRVESEQLSTASRRDLDIRRAAANGDHPSQTLDTSRLGDRVSQRCLVVSGAGRIHA